MASVRSALAAAGIAALGVGMAFGPAALEAGRADENAAAVQRLTPAESSPTPPTTPTAQTPPPAVPTTPSATPEATATGTTGTGTTGTGMTGTAARSQTRPAPATPASPATAPTPYPTMTMPAGVPAAPRPPTHENGRPVVYLTIDDGPDPTSTPQMLALLARHHAQATFFMVGAEIARFPAVAARVRAAGHAVGNHSYTHPWLTDLTPAAATAEITRTDAVLGANRCLRPPGGFVDATVGQVLKNTGKVAQLWDTDTKDWSRPGVPAIVDAAMAELRPGVIVLLHDGGGDRSQSVQALGQLLPAWSAKGYVLRALPACR